VLHAAESICHGDAFAVDIGAFNDRHFSYVAAFGLFTDVSYETPQNLKNFMGHLAYLLQGITKLANIRSYHCLVEYDGHMLEDDFVFGMVTNSRSIGGFRLPDNLQIKNNDGLFELVLLRKFHRFSELQNVVAALMNGDFYSRSFIVRHVKYVKIKCDVSPDWTLDGEYGGCYNNVDISVHQSALQIMAPITELDSLSL
jgi:diacylglycerol kinase family enzyme